MEPELATGVFVGCDSGKVLSAWGPGAVTGCWVFVSMLTLIGWSVVVSSTLREVCLLLDLRGSFSAQIFLRHQKQSNTDVTYKAREQITSVGFMRHGLLICLTSQEV